MYNKPHLLLAISTRSKADTAIAASAANASERAPRTRSALSPLLIVVVGLPSDWKATGRRRRSMSNGILFQIRQILNSLTNY